MSALRIMVQGTGSYVGKSVITSALCSYFRRQGYRVAPFKAQNMSNNSYVTPDGGEIGRAQAFQAACCGIEPAVEMNPVLLKPASDSRSQVVVLGKPIGHMRAREYHDYQSQLVSTVKVSFEALAGQYDIVVIEGAGSPAEINLRKFDIVNMFIAKMTKAPVLLIGDIHVGGVFASLVGTMELLESEERDLVKAFVINKFRGDITLLDEGIRILEERTHKKTLGVIPYVSNLQVEEEDGTGESRYRAAQKLSETLQVAVVRLPRIANSTDFEKLAQEPDVSLEYVASPAEIHNPDVIILPGTKSTIADLEFLHSSGLAACIQGMRTKGVPLVGICGGFQMMGARIHDPYHVESEQSTIEGLGLFPFSTTFAQKKRTLRVNGVSLQSGQRIVGYEIHMGMTEDAGTRPVFRITREGESAVDRQEGYISADGLAWGTYIHGLFDSSGFRREFLNRLRERRGWPPLRPQDETPAESVYDTLSSLVSNHLDCKLLQQILHQ